MMSDHPQRESKQYPPIETGPGNVLFDVWLVSRAVSALLDDAVRAVGLDADEYAVYSVLASGQPTTPTELARWMAAPPTTVSSYVKRFESRAHVERVTNPEDRRSHRLQLTDAGRQTHRLASERFGPILAEVEHGLGEQADEIHQGLQTLHEIIDALRHQQ